MTETIGSFRSAKSAETFVSRVASSMQTCQRHRPALTIRGSTPLTTNLATGRVWRISQQLSPTRSALIRTAIIRHEATVAEVTFTPAGDHDISQAEYVALARRAAMRLGT